ncbi:MAG TPA: glycosyltransferase family 39 protein, partial [Flavitalea sp.]|nr:glycosyltransferase family 39 protein [Flavitalea sp.]
MISGLVISWQENVYQWINAKFQAIGNWFGVTNWQTLLLFISFVFVFLAAAGAGPFPKMYSPGFAVISWMLGIGLVLIGGYRLGEKQPTISHQMASWAIGVTVIAFLFRGFATGNIPGFLTGDEASSGIYAAEFLKGNWNNIFTVGWYSFPSLFYFIQSAFIRFLGQTTEALRILSAIVGALTVGTVYLCGKAMFGHRAGILGALCLSALHFHIHFSRLGLNNVWDSLWYTIVVGALWYGWERNHRGAYLLAGLALGLSQYFYVSSKGLFGILLLGFIVAFFVRRIRLYQALPSLVLMFAVAVAVIFPLISFYFHEPNHFLAPIVRVSFLRETFSGPAVVIEEPVWKYAIEQIFIGMKAFTHTPIYHHYDPETPILRPMYAIFFFIGLVWLLLRNRDSRFVLLFLWLVTFGLIGGLSESAPSAQRYVAAAPACALIIGFGVSQLIDIVESRLQKRSWLFAGLVYMIVATAMINDLYFYFIEYESIARIENTASPAAIAQQL